MLVLHHALGQRVVDLRGRLRVGVKKRRDATFLCLSREGRGGAWENKWFCVERNRGAVRAGMEATWWRGGRRAAREGGGGSSGGDL